MTQASASSALNSSPAISKPARRRTASRYAFGYVTFILVNATLFIRPAEIISGAEWNFYEFLILLSLAASLPAVLKKLAWKSLKVNAGTLAVLGLLPAIALSHLSHGNLYGARTGAMDFLKTLAYFFLLIGLVDSLPRLRHFLGVIVIFIVFAAALAVLRYHGFIQLQSVETLNRLDRTDAETGEAVYIDQLQASGIFSDPNDFALILVTAILASIFFVTEAKGIFRRTAWLACFPILLYAFALTKSRGGFLSLMAGFGVYMTCRLGWRRGIMAGAVLFPIMLVLFAGRQTNIDLGNQNDTAMGRVLLWRDGLEFFRSAPLFGIGRNQYAEQADLVAHNSYVHAFAELGFFGGTLFLLALLSPILSCRKSELSPEASPLGRRLQPCILAIVVAYAIGLFSLSRDYEVPTYLVIGTACAFCGLASSRHKNSWSVFNVRLLCKAAAAGVLMIIFLYSFVRVMTA